MDGGIGFGLSVLVPVFNWDSSLLVADLCWQGRMLDIPFELIVADDCSSNEELKKAVKSAAAAQSDCCRYFPLERNMGRSAIRNFLADQAIYSKLLFIDCDAQVLSPQFLQNYLEASSKAQVVCGGLLHANTPPAAGHELRWKYEKRADASRSAACRSRHPYSQFTPFSFLIDRDCFQSVRFNEKFHGYGNEDVLLGLELERRGADILHLDNPLLHTGIEDSDTYLSKTDTAIANLVAHNSELAGGSRLLKTWRMLQRLHLTALLACVDTGRLKRNLTGPHPSLSLFALYKLCKLQQLFQDQEHDKNNT